jgi:two-component system NtrC family sensor kinase
MALSPANARPSEAAGPALDAPRGGDAKGEAVDRTGPASRYQPLLRRLLWPLVPLAIALVLLLLGALVGVSWRGLAVIEPVQVHLAELGQLQNLSLGLEQSLPGAPANGGPVAGPDLAALQDRLQALIRASGNLEPQTPAQLRHIARLLSENDGRVADALPEALAELRQSLAAEQHRQARLIEAAVGDARTELRLSLALLVALPLLSAGLWFLLRRRIQQPLNSLEGLLSRLAARDYRPVPEPMLEGSVALMQPVLRSFNELVLRLKELAAQHRDRERSLEHAVRGATEALLAQSRELARAERLAAVGAVSAGLAHELRNPLAGIHLACSKLRRGLAPEQGERLDAVLAELKRLNQLLTAQMDAARHAPEPLVTVDLHRVTDEFLSLVRYQIAEDIALRADVPDGLRCALPEAGLRQTLLNLVLNAAQAIGDAGGSIEIRMRRDGDTLSILVADDGPGFPQPILESALRPFASGRIGGTGLGLAMVRRFVQDLAGELRIDNGAAGGARVVLRLPCEHQPLAPGP